MKRGTNTKKAASDSVDLIEKATHSFQAETRQLLDLVINSLYSKKEIFLRELISNASDALDKLRFESKLDSSLLSPNYEPEIRVIPNEEKRTVTVMDNGVGMTRDEIIENIGTIAYSGTKKWTQLKKQLQENPELI